MLNKVARYRGTGTGNKITKEPGYIYTNDEGITIINERNQTKEIYDKKLEQFTNKVFDMPKKPKSAFTFYLIERIPSLKKEKPDALQPELFKLAAEEWQGGKEINKISVLK